LHFLYVTVGHYEISCTLKLRR